MQCYKTILCYSWTVTGIRQACLLHSNKSKAFLVCKNLVKYKNLLTVQQTQYLVMPDINTNVHTKNVLMFRTLKNSAVSAIKDPTVLEGDKYCMYLHTCI